MNLFGLLLWAQASLVAVERNPAALCPSTERVLEALAGRLPGAVVDPERARDLGALILRVEAGGEGAAPSFVLRDAKGDVRLQRSLTSSEGEPQQSCKALADTVALIVERYLQQLDDRALSPAVRAPAPEAVVGPAADSPPRDWDLSLATIWRPNADAAGGLEVALRVGRPWPSSRRWMLAAAAGVSGATEHRFAEGGLARTRRFPVELGVWGRAEFGAGELQAGILAGLDITHFEATATGPKPVRDRRTLLGPTVGLAAAYRLPIVGSLFLRLSSGVNMAAVRYDFVEPAAGSLGFSAPGSRFYAKLALDAGVGLR